VGDLAAVEHYHCGAVRALRFDEDLERDGCDRPTKLDAEAVVGEHHRGGRMCARWWHRGTVDRFRAAGSEEHDTDHRGHPQAAHTADPIAARRYGPPHHFSPAPASWRNVSNNRECPSMPGIRLGKFANIGSLNSAITSALSDGSIPVRRSHATRSVSTGAMASRSPCAHRSRYFC